MMAKEIWIEKLLSVVSEIASKRYQEEVWLGKQDRHVSSWEEVVCNFFDDYDADGFIHTYLKDDEYSTEKVSAFTGFRDSLDSYVKSQPSRVNSADIMNDPGWERIRTQAQKLLDIWQTKI